ncbi:transglutaminase-like domain-containing protein [Natranaerobius thermophilus]|uniref:Transglutaminase domain protein n=1 Tax=Natranaerobius thermophilus (strain ATCC BAA-1301 / DSM 18059 / JW/NM-WN-LF) TaxID=457570 RepID=B2A5U3_NATTJ|nr:transglutaminase-like domain-containing protein [Natranaerobius thermophilus]ACB84036.1 transglutaminase domain protein [Natranaerobius thermophilus JW/NM-WN-LF]
MTKSGEGGGYLEFILLLITNCFLVSSFVDFFGYSPQWTWLVVAGAIALMVFYFPKVSGISILVAISFICIMVYFSDPIRELFIQVGGDFLTETAVWINHGIAGTSVATGISVLVLFGLMLIQLIFINRGKTNFHLVIVGSLAYIGLWFQHYPRAEQELILFLLLAVPTSALFHLRTKSYSYAKLSYKIGILILGLITSLVVAAFPKDMGPVTFETGYRFVETYFPFLQELRSAETNGEITVGEGEEEEQLEDEKNVEKTEDTEVEREVGYQPGGDLGGALTTSTDIVAEIILESGSFPIALYLRGQGNDYYDGSSWDAVQSEDSEDLEEAFRYVDVYQEELEVTVSYKQGEQDIFGLFPTNNVELGKEQEYYNLEIDSYGNMTYSEGKFKGDYKLKGKIISDVNLDNIEPQEELEKSIVNLFPYIQLPEHLPERVKQLSNEITEEAENNLEKARLVENYLSTEYSYETDMPEHPPKEDFVDKFLFEHEKGYCTYFASAMAVLLRVQDVPTRYVEGYRVPLYPEDEDLIDAEIADTIETDRMLAQSNHAHAWVEVFLDGYGWVVFESTQPYEITTGLIDQEEHLEDTESEKDEDEIVQPREKQPVFVEPLWFSLFIIPVAILGGGTLVVITNLSQVKDPIDLYEKMILLRKLYYKEPKPDETPAKIISQYQVEIPELAKDMDDLKRYYEISYYSSNSDIVISKRFKETELNKLPLKTAKVYLSRVGLLRFSIGIIRLGIKLLLSKLTGV